MPIDGAEFIIGSKDICLKPLCPYSSEALSFTSDFSKALLKNPLAKQYPDISALGFWCRRANLLKLKEGCPEADCRLGRGLCLHIAPGNIPINFAFSYFFGLLSGCSNIVRLPSKVFAQNEVVLQVFKELLPKHPEIAKRSAFVRYKASDEITAELCKKAGARIIWGGDSTIARIKALPCPPRCVDIAFADRYSICVINADEILPLNQEALKRLARNFYNDTYLVDQNACSSPQTIFWLNDDKKARATFWKAVYDEASRAYALQPAISVDKYAKLCEDALDYGFLSTAHRQTNLLYQIEAGSLPDNINNLRGKGGYFYETAINSLKELIRHVDYKLQTLTYFGLDPQEIRSLIIQNRLTGIDRVVPIGKALDIGIMWDGFDIVRYLSRYAALT